MGKKTPAQTESASGSVIEFWLPPPGSQARIWWHVESGSPVRLDYIAIRGAALVEVRARNRLLVSPTAWGRAPLLYPGDDIEITVSSGGTTTSHKGRCEIRCVEVDDGNED